MDPHELGSRSAFPMTIVEHPVNSPGLTKREAAAIAALNGLLASGRTDVDLDECIELAVAYADRLMTELAKEQV
jgi:hypothetical protein